MDAHSFRSEATVVIKDRGRAYAFGPEQIPAGMWDPCDLLGTTVTINDKKRKVTGVGTFAIARSPDNPYRLSFDLLVEHE